MCRKPSPCGTGVVSLNWTIGSKAEQLSRGRGIRHCEESGRGRDGAALLRSRHEAHQPEGSPHHDQPGSGAGPRFLSDGMDQPCRDSRCGTGSVVAKTAVAAWRPAHRRRRLCHSSHGVHRVSFDRRTPAMAMGILADSDCLPTGGAAPTRSSTAAIRTDDTRRAHLVRHPARRDRGGAGPNRDGDDPRLSALRGLGIVKSRVINPSNAFR